MASLYNAFYIILFTSLIGGVFTIVSFLINRIFRIVLPLWAGFGGMALYVVPVFSPGLFPVSPERQIWVEGYKLASVIWGCGIILSALCCLLRMQMGYRAINCCRICDERHINSICVQCAVAAKLKIIPTVYFGGLDDPACVIGVVHPKIILNKKVAARLSEVQLTAVLEHEIMHIKRGHMVLGRINDVICILNWFNPIAWAAKREFDVLCEIDCDRSALSVLRGKIDHKEYALTMLRLLELSAVGVSVSGVSLSVSGFLLTKRRMVLVMNNRSALYRIFSTLILLTAVILVICFSVKVSRGYFYPYPAYSKGTEYSQAVQP